MWTNQELKGNAWASLKRYYWMGLLVCVITGFLTGGFSGSVSGLSNIVTPKFDQYDVNQITSGDLNLSDMFDTSGISYADSLQVGATVLGIVIAIAFFAMLVGLAYSAFVANPVKVGKSRFFMLSRGFDNVNLGQIFYSFRNGRYLKTVKTMFVTNLFIFLWSLLLIIPGIIKSYEYCMVAYIMSENPQIPSARARELSRAMTDGEKFRIFVLQLSFIGWFLLALLLSLCCCGIGTIFVYPYYEATMAELYTVLRTKALQSGMATETELCGYNLAD